MRVTERAHDTQGHSRVRSLPQQWYGGPPRCENAPPSPQGHERHPAGANTGTGALRRPNHSRRKRTENGATPRVEDGPGRGMQATDARVSFMLAIQRVSAG
jgi:hypothetical protein